MVAEKKDKKQMAAAIPRAGIGRPVDKSPIVPPSGTILICGLGGDDEKAAMMLLMMILIF